MTLLHRHEHEAGEEERQKERETVGVVEPREQHQEQQGAEGEPGAGRQNVEAPPLEDYRELIDALAAAHPARRARIQGGGKGCERTPAPWRAGRGGAHGLRSVPARCG